MFTNQKEDAAKALEVALANGCQAARICLSISTQSSCSVRKDKIDRLHQSTGSSLYIQLFVDGRYGSFSTNRTEADEVSKFIAKGIEATRLLTPDPCRLLPEKALYFTGEGLDLKQYDNSYSSIDQKKKLEIVFNCSAEVAGKDKRVISVNSEYGDSDDYFYMIDSQGFENECSQTSFAISSECSVKGRGDARPEAWWYESSMFFDSLKKEGCGNMALQRALSRLHPIKLKSGKYNMVIENTVSSRMISPIVSALNGASIQQNNSFLKDMIDKRVFSPRFTLFDNAHLVGSAGARYFDGDGVATKPMSIIENGVIKTYFINTYHSKKLDMPVTVDGPSVLTCLMDNNFSEGETRDLGYILAECGTGIFVTGFNGGNCNSSSGDFSYGVEGFFFENGKILHPIKEMNVSGNIISLWNNLIDLGTDPRNTSRWLIPTLAFESVDFSGI